MEQESDAVDDSSGIVNLDSIGMGPLSLIEDAQFPSLDGREENLTLSNTLLPDMMKADGENVVDCSLNNIIIINGEKFVVGDQPSDSKPVFGQITTKMETNQTCSLPDSLGYGVSLTPGTGIVQIIRTNKPSSSSSTPPVGKVPISRLNKTAVSDSVVITPSLRTTSRPNILSKPMTMDLSGMNLIADSAFVSPNMFLQIETENGAMNAAVPVKLCMTNSPTHMPELVLTPQECLWEDCGTMFDSMDDLVNHVNDQHVKMSEREIEYICKWHQCPRRGKGFNARYKMLIHVRTHTKEKPYICNQCSKSFSRLENLKIHGRCHTGEKPYPCPFEGCNKAYSNSSDRFKHVRTHKVDRPYPCRMPGCGKKYTDPSSLRKHMKTHGHFWTRSHEEIKFQDSDPLSKDSEELCLLNENSNNIVTPDMTSAASQSCQSQGINVQGTVIDISNLASNPLLSSTVLSTGASANGDDKTGISDLPLKEELQSDGGVEDLVDEKNSETPIDLSSSPIASMELIHSGTI